MKKKNDSPKEAFEGGMAVLLNYQQSHPHNQVKQVLIKWDPPPLDFLMLNIDGALFFDLQKVGIGCLLRDHQGQTIMATSLVDNFAMNLQSIEVVAILRSLQLCLRQGIHSLIIESDCSLLVGEILTLDTSNSALGNIILEIQNLMSSFITCTLQHVSWLCNFAAHKLARNAWHVCDALLWFNSIPDFIEQINWFESCNV